MCQVKGFTGKVMQTGKYLSRAPDFERTGVFTSPPSHQNHHKGQDYQIKIITCPLLISCFNNVLMSSKSHYILYRRLIKDDASAFRSPH